jgi:hypothetical protein
MTNHALHGGKGVMKVIFGDSRNMKEVEDK